MFGLLLLTLALASYPTKYRRWSLFLFIFFSLECLRLINKDLLGAKSLDLAFIYMLVVNIYSYFYERDGFTEFVWINRLVLWLSLFLLGSICYSYIHYQFTTIQIIQGGRQLFLFLSYYFLRKVKREEIEWLIDVFFKITLIHAVLYCVQVLTGIDVLFYGEASIDNVTGMGRYYNYPTLLPFYLSFCMLYTKYQGRRISAIAIIVLIIALFCTQGRTYILTTIGVILFGIALRGPASRVLYGSIILALCTLPFSDLLYSRLANEGRTENDLVAVFNGDFKEDVAAGRTQEGTMSYRIAWVYERALYLQSRPLGEKCFGLGMISDSQTDLVYSRYHFFTGLRNEETGEPTQLCTSDIAWGNILVTLGYLGGFIYIVLWIYASILLYQYRRVHPIILCGFVFIVSLWLCSIADANLSQTGFLVFPFLLLAGAIQSDAIEEEDFEG